jgi:predicted  nucleic acid-binding Zn-ribbon protein
MATSNSSDNTSILGNLQETDDKMKDLIITEKGKLKWRGDLTTLQQFLDKALNIKGNWTTASGAKTLKTDKTTIRWYSQNESLTIGGTDAEKIKGSLESRAMVIYSGETSETDSITKSKHFDSDKNEASELNTNEDEYSGSLNIIVEGLKTELTELKSQFDTYRTNTNQTLKTLQDKQVRGLCDEKQNENNKLREENYKLKQENNDLNQRINNLENKLADLNGKIRTSDEEKASLIAAIRLLQSDIGNGQVETSNERTAWLESGSKRDSRKYRHNTQSQSNRLTKEIPTSNRYLSLEIDESQSPVDISSDNCSDDEKLNREAAQAKKSQRNEKSNIKIAPAHKPQDSTTNLPQKPTSPKPRTQHTTEKPQDSTPNLPQKPTSPKPRTQYTTGNTIAILGDSMIKMIKPARLQRSTDRKIIVKTFPGAAVKDMNHYLKPTLEKNPEMIVLHVGTNDIPKKNPSDIVNEIESLGKIIVENGSTKVAISEIIQREDQVLNTKVKETNTLLYQLCSKYKWPIIHHTNINTSNLNQSGLHLNPAGTKLLAKNYIVFLKK